MTGEEAIRAFEIFRSEGKTDEEIKITMFMMFRGGDLSAYDFYQLCQLLGLPIDNYFLSLNNERQKDYLSWDEKNKKTIVRYEIDNEDDIFGGEEDDTININDKEYFEGFFEKMRKKGMSDEEILVTLYLMFKDDKLALEQFVAIIGHLGYEMGEEFEKASMEDKKNMDLWFGTQEESQQDNNKEINFDIVDDDLEDDLNEYFKEEEE